jgi:lipoate-protein ligase B
MLSTSAPSTYCSYKTISHLRGDIGGDIGLWVSDLGFIDYGKAYEIQRQILEEVKFGSRPDTLILAEHSSVFTIGRTGCRDNILVDEQTLSKEGIEIYYVDRGGDVTYHGPGQLLIYPIVDLKRLGIRIHSFLRRLEELVIVFLNEYGVSAERKNRFTGIWVQDKKIASIGIGVSRWVTYHGLAINVDPDLHYFSMINPCGIPGLKVTSLAKVLGREINVEEAKDLFMRLAETESRPNFGGE